MKKLIPVLLLMLLLLSCLALSAGAVTADRGETVTLYVALPAAARAQMGGISFTYDDTCLTLTAGTWQLPGDPMLASVDVQKNTATFLYGEEQEISGEILALTMYVKEGASYGDYTIKAEVKLVAEGGTMEEATTLAATVTPLTLVCQHTHTETVDRQEPTCAEAGYTAGTRCLDCGVFLAGHESLAAVPCTFTAELAEEKYFCREKDCTHGDLYYKSCAMCGKADTDATFAVGEPLPHTPGTAATCTAPQSCTVCDATIEEALGHSYDGSGICTRCGYIQSTEKDDNKDNKQDNKQDENKKNDPVVTFKSCKSQITAATGWQPALLLALTLAIVLKRKKKTGDR